MQVAAKVYPAFERHPHHFPTWEVSLTDGAVRAQRVTHKQHKSGKPQFLCFWALLIPLQRPAGTRACHSERRCGVVAKIADSR